MFSWLFRKNRADPDAEVHALTKRISALERRCGDLDEALQAEVAKAFAFRGRVYAVLGRRGVKLAEEDAREAAGEAEPTSLNDPRLTKAEVKARLGLTTPAGVAKFLRGNKH